MHRRTISLLAAVVSACAVAPVRGEPTPFRQEDPIPYFSHEKWGYADGTRKLVIPASFDRATRFREGQAEVLRGEQWAFIDRQGREVIPLRYAYVMPFSDGLAAVGRDTGEPSGLEQYGPRPGQRRQLTISKYGFIDHQGRVIVPLEYEWVMPFQEGVSQVVLRRSSPKCPTASVWGMIDRGGRLILPIEHCHVGPSNGGIVRVVYESRGPNDARVGFVDRVGRVVLPMLPYDWAAEQWREDLLLVRDHERWGFVDRAGKQIVPPRYEEAASFVQGRARVRRHGKWGFIDRSGREVIPCRFDAAADFAEGLAEVAIDGKVGFIGKAGGFVVPPRFDANRRFDRSFYEGLHAVPLGGKWGYIDRTGALAIRHQFDDAWGFSEGLAAAEQGSQWGFIDRDGRWAIAPKYFRVDEGFVAGFARVKVRAPDPRGPGLWKWSGGYVDRQGREFFDPPREHALNVDTGSAGATCSPPSRRNARRPADEPSRFRRFHDHRALGRWSLGRRPNVA